MISRARPLLGTFVSIRTDGDERAVNAAFAAIEKVHRLMNVHSSEGDLARINRLAARNRAGRLTSAENEELENYIKVGQTLGILKSKARRSLRSNGKKGK